MYRRQDRQLDVLKPIDSIEYQDIVHMVGKEATCSWLRSNVKLSTLEFGTAFLPVTTEVTCLGVIIR